MHQIFYIQVSSIHMHLDLKCVFCSSWIDKINKLWSLWDTQSLWNCWNGWTITKWILFLNEHISNQETLLQSPCKNKMEGGGNEFNTYTGCPCDLSLNINFRLFILNRQTRNFSLVLNKSIKYWNCSYRVTITFNFN